MNNSIKSLALLFASVAFTACTNPSIEPIRPAIQTQHIVRVDTMMNGGQINTAGRAEQSTDLQYEQVMTNEEFNQNYPRPQIIASPANPVEPHTVPAPKPRPDVMPIEQLEAGEY